jgi:hypothetical protein
METGVIYLVSPEQLIAPSVLDSIPSMKKLRDAMFSNMVCILLCFIP